MKGARRRRLKRELLCVLLSEQPSDLDFCEAAYEYGSWAGDPLTIYEYSFVRGCLMLDTMPQSAHISHLMPPIEAIEAANELCDVKVMVQTFKIQYPFLLCEWGCNHSTPWELSTTSVASLGQISSTSFVRAVERQLEISCNLYNSDQLFANRVSLFRAAMKKMINFKSMFGHFRTLCYFMKFDRLQYHQEILHEQAGEGDVHLPMSDHSEEDGWAPISEDLDLREPESMSF